MSAGLAGLFALEGIWLAKPGEVPRQVEGAKGPLMRPVFDHILDARPGAVAQQMREIRGIDETLRKVTRNEREPVEAGSR